MICEEIVKGEKGYLCGQNNGIYACENCNEETKECHKCLLIPIPTKVRNESTQYAGVSEYDGLVDTIKSYLTDKKFLTGVGVGLLLGVFLFGRK